jgi:hypothetical protein
MLASVLAAFSGSIYRDAAKQRWGSRAVGMMPPNSQLPHTGYRVVPPHALPRSRLRLAPEA